MYRTDISLRFQDGVSDAAKRAFFLRHSMTVLGVTHSSQFFVRIPDPGPSVESLLAVLGRLRGEAEVGIVSLVPRSPLPVPDP